MLRLIIIFCVLIPFNANSVEFSAIFGGYSTHIGKQSYPNKYVYRPDVKYNSDHRVKAIEINHKRFSVTASSFINSYYQKSLGISIHYKIKNLFIGASAANGYKTHIEGSKNIVLAPSIRYDMKYVSFYTIGAAAVTSFKIPIL